MSRFGAECQALSPLTTMVPRCELWVTIPLTPETEWAASGTSSKTAELMEDEDAPTAAAVAGIELSAVISPRIPGVYAKEPRYMRHKLRIHLQATGPP